MESVTNFFKQLYEKTDTYIKANPRRTAIIGGVVLLLLLSVIFKALGIVYPPHVSLAGQPLMQDGPSWFTNSLLTTLVVDIIILLLAFAATRNLSMVPSGLQNLMETLLEFILNLAESVAGKSASTFFPWLATIFIFVLISNYSGLIPVVGSVGFCHTEHEATHATLNRQLAMADGMLILQEEASEPANVCAPGSEFAPWFRAPSADLSTTFGLALATMFMVQYHGVRTLGLKYFRKFAFWSPTGEGFMKGINGFVIFLELISELSRILTFAFRLFGNIFAGEVVLAVMAYLITFIIPVPFYALEVMVGAIQAFVFTMLTLVFFQMATISHDHSEEHH